MKRLKRLTSQMLAVLLVGTLMMGSLPVSAFGADGDLGATSEVVASEVATEEAVEEVSDYTEDESVETDSADTEFSAERSTEEVATVNADTTGTATNAVAVDTADTADTAEIADTVDDPASSFTVTLDANGGYFVNEWDDVLGEYVDRTEILNKVIPVGEAVSIVPMRDPEDILTFLGWSLERDGEVVVQGEYAPLDSCTLFAVWETVDETVDNIEDEIQEDDSEEAPVADEIEDDGEQGRTDETDIPATTEDNKEVADEDADENAKAEDEDVESDDNPDPADNTDQQLQKAVEETVPDEAASIVEEETDEEKISTEPMFTGESISGNHMWYRYNGNIDIRGYDGSNPIQTTYNDNGYETVLLCDGDKETLQFSQNGEAASHESGLTVTPNISFSSDGYYTIVKYTVKNTSITSKSFSLGVCADVDIDSDDCASVYKTNNGLRMVSSSGGRTYYLVCRNISGAISAGTLWFGPYGNRFDNAYNDTDDTELTGIDSGLAFSWKNQVISAGGSATYVYQIGIGETGVIEDYNDDNYFKLGVDTNQFIHYGLPYEFNDDEIKNKLFLSTLLTWKSTFDFYKYLDGNISGVCHGIAMSMCYGNQGLIDYNSISNSASNYWQLGDPRDNTAFKDLVLYYHLTQLSYGGDPTKKLDKGGWHVKSLESRMEDFLKAFVQEAKKSSVSKKPFVFGFRENGDGHSVVVCGYKWNENTKNHEIVIYDENSYDGIKGNYCKMMVPENCHSFDFADANAEYGGYKIQDVWTSLSFYGIDKIYGSSNILKRSSSLSKANNSTTTIQISAGKAFRLEDEYGNWISFDGTNYSGNMSVYDCYISGLDDAPYWNITVDKTSKLQLKDFESGCEICVQIDGKGYAVSSNGADSITIQPNIITAEGEVYSIDISVQSEKYDILQTKASVKGTMTVNIVEEILIVSTTGGCDEIKAWRHNQANTEECEVEADRNGNVSIDFENVNNTSNKCMEYATVTGLSAKTYTGSAITQAPTVTLGSTTLTPNTDYTVSYSNNTNAGTATVTITGIGNYNGTTSATFKINKAAQSITAKATASSIAVGKTATVSITGNKGKKSYKSSNTAVATVNASTGKVTAKKVGTVKITATSAATSNYNAASKTVTIKIVPVATSKITAANQAKGIKVAWKKVTGANGYIIYRNNQKAKTITSGSTVTWTDTAANTNGTKYVYKIVAKASTGNSTLNKSLTTYKVARPTVKTLKNSASKKMTVKWAKNGKATGYQIQYSTSKKFSSGNKTTTVTKVGTVSKTIGSLAAGKTYYVRIRTYKTVGKTKYWSAWSATKNVKIKPLAIVKQGTCGKGVKWKLDSYGKLTFSGSGSIPGYYLNAPWQAKAKSINSIVIGNGIIGIGENTFYDCDTLTSVTIPASVTKIGKDAFAWCNKLTKVKISKSLTNKYAEAFIHTPWFNSIVDKKLAIRIYSRELKGKKGEFCLLYITNDNIPDLIYKSVPYDYTLYINGAYMESVCVGGPGTKLYFAYYPYKNFYKICDDKKYPSYYTVASENGLIGCYECLSAVSYGYYEGYISDYDGGRSFNYNLNKWIADREITKKEFNAIKTKRADGESEKGCKFLKISKSNLAKNGLDAYK